MSTSNNKVNVLVTYVYSKINTDRIHCENLQLTCMYLCDACNERKGIEAIQGPFPISFTEQDENPTGNLTDQIYPEKNDH